MRNLRPIRPETTPENRLPRINVRGDIGVEVGLTGQFPEVRGSVHMVNTGGMSMWCETPLPEGAECDFRLKLIEGGLDVTGHGWVVSTRQGHMAIQFDNLMPEAADALSRHLERFQTTAA